MVARLPENDMLICRRSEGSALAGAGSLSVPRLFFAGLSVTGKSAFRPSLFFSGRACEWDAGDNQP
jgi:hypothetical protein